MNKISLPNIFLYEFDIDTVLIDRFMEKFKEIEKDTKSAPSNANDSQSCFALYMPTSENKYIPFYEEKLFAELQKRIDEVTRIHFIENTKLAICDSWITKAEFGLRGTWHNHSMSFISGLLYLTDHDKSETCFSVKDTFYETHKHMYEPILKKQAHEYKVKPKKGKLLIWDSTIGHQLSPHTGKTTRYTLAFNTYLTGDLSSRNPSGRLYLNCLDVKEQTEQY